MFDFIIYIYKFLDVAICKLLMYPKRVEWFHNIRQMNRPISSIPQCMNVSDKYLTMHYFVTEMCTFLLQNAVLWDMEMVHCGIYALNLFIVA